MEHIIKKILTECGYVEKGQGILFHSKEDKSFFFTISIAEENFITLRNKELIKLNQEYKAVMDAFKTIVNSGEQITIEKNSSLIVLVKCANINSIANLQQQILLFEEDEYFFKKYVILYTDNSILELTVNPIIPQLRTKVNDNEKFNQFAAQGYVS
ncbi:MAG: ABC-three component system middle component 1, partial [Bacteroidota bacterium]